MGGVSGKPAETPSQRDAPQGAGDLDNAARRNWCVKCGRAGRICICSALPDGPLLSTRTRIVVLVHPKEAQRKLGTAPLLKLCLADIIMRYAEGFPEPGEDPELHAAMCADGHRCVLVCPGPEAEELRAPEAASEGSSPASGLTLIFIDGRWKQAKAMVNRSRWLQNLPRVVLRPSSASGYTFRRQPVEGCLSTLEAVAEALAVLEGNRGAEIRETLVAPFRRMVELQCAFIPGLHPEKAEDERQEEGKEEGGSRAGGGRGGGGDESTVDQRQRREEEAHVPHRAPPKWPSSWKRPGLREEEEEEEEEGSREGGQGGEGR